MKKIIIIGVFALFTLSACEDNLNVTEDLSSFNISESEYLNNLSVYSNLPRDGRNPQTGLCPECFMVPCICEDSD